MSRPTDISILDICLGPDKSPYNLLLDDYTLDIAAVGIGSSDIGTPFLRTKF